MPNSTFLKENIDPAHFSPFFQKRWWSISQAIVSKENASQAPFFQYLASTSVKKISIHIIRQHVKHDTIAIYYCPAHEQRSADMESSNLQSEYATQGHRYICSL